MAGKSSMPELKELGPYSYSAKHEKRVEDWGEDGTITFKTR